MRLLIVDNTIDRDSWGAEDFRSVLVRLAKHQASSANVTLSVRRAPQEDLPRSPRAFDRVILTGSKTSALEDAPWISKLRQFVRESLNENVPILGVCYGHQVLANVLTENEGKKICRRSQIPEYGWAAIELTGRAPLFEGLPQKFHSFSAHTEEVESLPSGTRALARSEGCAIQAFQLEGRPVYGIQFHPERDVAGAERSLGERKKTRSAIPLLRPDQGTELYDPKIGETLIGNFLHA